MTLDSVGPGEYRIIELSGGHGFVKKLTDMGIYPGVIVRVISSSPFGGPVRIVVKGSQYAIGKGMASKIYVSKVS